jgi:hypothetical protein
LLAPEMRQRSYPSHVARSVVLDGLMTEEEWK